MGDSGSECRIYVGNLPPDIRSKDIEDLFYKSVSAPRCIMYSVLSVLCILCILYSSPRYGKIVFIDLKNRRGPPFAFVEFEDTRDAEVTIANFIIIVMITIIVMTTNAFTIVIVTFATAVLP